ncbi:unnamed protein product [Moneuplotes crassus]|uniref:Uncharacterized protein n=1 Tax=Euplotes crassus TaxID=5936 RepID=A0AAD1XVT7_EUPCR|nr:unnamed protein product [Moneuplotes crassus]
MEAKNLLKMNYSYYYQKNRRMPKKVVRAGIISNQALPLATRQLATNPETPSRCKCGVSVKAPRNIVNIKLLT